MGLSGWGLETRMCAASGQFEKLECGIFIF